MLAKVSRSTTTFRNYEAAIWLLQKEDRVKERERAIYSLLLITAFNFRLSRSHNGKHAKSARHSRGLLQIKLLEIIPQYLHNETIQYH